MDSLATAPPPLPPKRSTSPVSSLVSTSAPTSSRLAPSPAPTSSAASNQLSHFGNDDVQVRVVPCSDDGGTLRRRSLSSHRGSDSRSSSSSSDSSSGSRSIGDADADDDEEDEDDDLILDAEINIDGVAMSALAHLRSLQPAASTSTAPSTPAPPGKDDDDDQQLGGQRDRAGRDDDDIDEDTEEEEASYQRVLATPLNRDRYTMMSFMTEATDVRLEREKVEFLEWKQLEEKRSEAYERARLKQLERERIRADELRRDELMRKLMEEQGVDDEVLASASARALSLLDHRPFPPPPPPTTPLPRVPPPSSASPLPELPMPPPPTPLPEDPLPPTPHMRLNPEKLKAKGWIVSGDPGAAHSAWAALSSSMSAPSHFSNHFHNGNMYGGQTYSSGHGGSSQMSHTGTFGLGIGIGGAGLGATSSSAGHYSMTTVSHATGGAGDSTSSQASASTTAARMRKVSSSSSSSSLHHQSSGSPAARLSIIPPGPPMGAAGTRVLDWARVASPWMPSPPPPRTPPPSAPLPPLNPSSTSSSTHSSPSKQPPPVPPKLTAVPRPTPSPTTWSESSSPALGSSTCARAPPTPTPTPPMQKDLFNAPLPPLPEEEARFHSIAAHARDAQARLEEEVRVSERVARERAEKEAIARAKWAKEQASRDRLDAWERSLLESKERNRRERVERLREEEKKRADAARLEAERQAVAEREALAEAAARRVLAQEREARLRKEYELRRAGDEAALERAAKREEARLKLKAKLEELELGKSMVLNGSITVQSGDSLIWRRRWFELRGNSMLLFKSEHDKQEVLERIELRNTISSITDAYEECQMVNSFKVTFVPGSGARAANSDGSPALDSLTAYTDAPEDRDVLRSGIEVVAAMEL